MRTLGKSGVQVSLVGMGTGSIGSGQASNQTKLGVKGFTKVVRHALDHGVTFFDVADQYGSHVFLREALKGVPRDEYPIQTKTHATELTTPRPPRPLPAGIGRRLHRHRPAALHDQGRLAAEHPGAMDYLGQAKDRESSAPTARATTGWTRSGRRPRRRSSRSTSPGSTPRG